MKQYIYTLFLLIACVACVHEESISWPDTPRGNVEALWTIIDEKYCFVEEKGLDWNGVLADYLYRADTMQLREQQVDNQRALFALLASMLDTLQDGHVNLYTSFDVSRSTKWYEDYPVNYDAALLQPYMGDYKTAGGLIYNRIPGHPKVGYVRYSSFSSGFSAANIYYIISYLKECDGLILDVRQNGGGDLTNAWKLASTFMDETTLVGYWQHKTGKEHQDFSAPEALYVNKDDMPSKWLRPVVVLCNRHSYSATNSFVNAMRYAPHAIIMGGTTGGGGGMPLSYELPNGWMVRFSSVRMMDRDKKSIEDGILPDETVTLTSTDKDDIMERAIQYIEQLKHSSQQ